MARVFSTADKTFHDVDAGGPVQLGADAIWIDLLNPTAAEERVFEELLGLDLPLREEMKSIEPSSRLYRENEALFMTATVMSGADTMNPEAMGIGFILKGSLLVTIRYTEPRSLAAFSSHLVRHAEHYPDGRYVFCGLLEAIVERAAEILEKITADSDMISRTIFHQSGNGDIESEDSHARTLRKIAYLQNQMGKVRDSLVSLGRMVHFSGLAEAFREQALEEQIRSIERDIHSLGDQATFIASTIGFLLNASLGLINIEQNGIIKFFSVVAVIFLPPTLIASIYGMNFGFMPELHWHMGYPIALVLMFLSAACPYMWFKYKRWL